MRMNTEQNPSTRLLLVDDDEVLLRALKRSLTALGYGVSTCGDGTAVCSAVASVTPDLVILDVMLPGKDGFAVLRETRELYRDLPVIMLTARSEAMDKVLGLEMGADDYLAKPFNVRELEARVKAVLRRTSGTQALLPGITSGPGVAPQDLQKPQKLQKLQMRHGDFLLDLQGHRVWKAGRELSLTAREFDVLALLFRHPGTVFTRERLLESCWGYDYLGDSRAVDVLVSRLREKVEDDPASPAVIRTRRGVGYYSE